MNRALMVPAGPPRATVVTPIMYIMLSSGRRLFETMLVSETDPSMRDTELRARTFGSRVTYEGYGRARDEPD
jgi:hypothetical protein